MVDETWTIIKTLQWTTTYFESHGIDQSRTDAEVLLAHALHLKRIELYTNYDKPLRDQELKTFKSLIQRRILREPVAYIIEKKEFWSLDLMVTPDVLIPRPETECLVEAALDFIPKGADCDILDLGTGSGAIILALAHERPGHRFYAVDRSEAALIVARKNAQRHGLEKAITFLQGDWFEGVRNLQKQFDIIVSNPPYIPTHQIKELSPEIAQYEPRYALNGGKDGLDAVRFIIRTAPDYLVPKGKILLEIGYDQRSAIAALTKKLGCYKDFVCLKDYGKNDRVVQITLA
jgi:release factor glutamine methyltransferase